MRAKARFRVSSVSLQVGAVSSPASQPAAPDLNGSAAMTLISTWSHFGHSNSRCSKPAGPGETRSSIIRVWQREQQGRSITVRKGWDECMMLPLVRRETRNSRSPLVCRSGAATEPACSSRFHSLWSILLTHRNVLRTASRGSRVTWSGRYVRYTSQAVENIARWSIRTTTAELAHAGLIGLCSRLPKLPRAVNTMAPAHRRPLGPFHWRDLRPGFKKNLCMERAGVSHAERVRRLVSAPMGTPVQSSDGAAPCLINKGQFHQRS